MFVAWPRVGKPRTDGYPVVYVFDGNTMFASVAQRARGAGLVVELKQAVIVGVGYPTDDPAVIERERIFDLSPPATPASLPPMLKGIKIGGAADFMECVLTEVQP